MLERDAFLPGAIVCNSQTITQLSYLETELRAARRFQQNEYGRPNPREIASGTCLRSIWRSGETVERAQTYWMPCTVGCTSPWVNAPAQGSVGNSPCVPTRKFCLSALPQVHTISRRLWRPIHSNASRPIKSQKWKGRAIGVLQVQDRPTGAAGNSHTISHLLPNRGKISQVWRTVR